MEQRSHERGSCRPNFSLHENQCPITATETDADSLAWPSSDEYLTSHSASSGDETTARPCPFEENHCSSHQLEESSSDDASPEPSSSTRPCKQHTAEAFTSDGKPSSGLVPFQGQHEAKVHVASPDEPTEELKSASTHRNQLNTAPSPTSLEESIIEYFAAHNLETTGLTRSVNCNATPAPSTVYPQRDGVESSYSAPGKRSSYVLTLASEKQTTESTHSAPERTYSNPFDEVTEEEVQRRRFGPLWTMDHCSLIRLAMDVRNSMLTEHEDCFSCQVIDRLNGSFNMVYILQFADGLKYVIRLPALGWGIRWTPTAKKAFESQVLTMHLIRRMTDIPLPEILAFDATQGNSLETPYMVISFISGVTVEALWRDETGPTPLEERRSRILCTTAMAMAQLQNLKFDWIGSLQLNDEPNEKSLGIGPCYEWDLPSRYAELQGQDPGVREYGPFRTTKEYLTHLHNLQHRHSHPMAVGCRELLTRMIASLPLSIDEACHTGYDETFVLTAPDFDSQNFMIDERGNLAGIIDWDHVQTMPRFLGYCRYPEWISRDCDPIRYEYPSNANEDSPEQLRRYRRQYAAEMEYLLCGRGDARFAEKSHIFGAVWIAAARYDCQVSLMSELLDRALARYQNSNIFTLIEAIGKGNWPMSEAKVMEGLRLLFEVQRVETTESARAEKGIER